MISWPMTILCTADLHLNSSHRAFPLGADGASDLLRIQREAIHQLVDEYRTGSYDLLLVAGDVTDASTLDPATMTLLFEFIHLLNEEDHGPVVILEGNHCIDRVDNLYTVMGAAGLVTHPHVHVSIRQEKLELSCSKGDFDVWCFPYRSDYAGIEADIAEASQEALSSTRPQIMTFHLPTSNAVMDNGFEAKKGVAMRAEITQGFDLGIGGDYHTHQVLKGNPKCFYTGAPFDLKFAEHQPRAFRRVELHSEGFELHPIPVKASVPLLMLSLEEVLADPDKLKNAVVRITDPITPMDQIKLDQLESYAVHKDVRSREKDELEREEIDVVDLSLSSDSDLDQILSRCEGMDEIQMNYLRGVFRRRCR